MVNIDEWGLEDSLQPVDALCARWVRDAVRWSMASNEHPMWRGERGSGEEPTLSDEVMLLDKVLATAPKHYVMVVKEWYSHDEVIEAKAKRIGISRSSLYQLWHRSLEYIRGRLHGEGLNI